MTDKIEALREKAPPVAWRWVWKTTGSPLERRFADPDLYMWTYRDSEPSGEAAKKMDVEPLYSEADYLSLLSELDRLRSSNEAMRKALEDLCGVMDHCSVTSGICGCGESMDNHSEWSGHSPTDYGSYVAEKAYQSARAALSLQEEEAR